MLFTAVAAVFAADRGAPSWSALVLLLVSGFLVAGGAAALNHYFDRDIDSAMSRTRLRPLVTGQIRPPEIVLGAGSAMIGAGVLVAAAFNPIMAALLSTGAFIYVVVYTLWLKRRNPLNIVVGGLAGSCAVLSGWALVDPGLGVLPLLLAAVVFLWTPAHFWSLALVRVDDYRRAGVPMLPAVVGAQQAARLVAVHVAGTVALSLGLQRVASLGPLYLALATGGGLVFLWMGARLIRHPAPAAAWPLFKFSGVYLGLLFFAVLLDRVLGGT